MLTYLSWSQGGCHLPCDCTINCTLIWLYLAYIERMY
uniref:Uncharacterized protein n=1 Tax=Siphoviridae sp. ctbxa26 TaxID=2825568 RepID=A0A8S5VF11_9CAUD|nr:MAG TPA: hypothetical protein [Siphoviridae sp. ctbxa26]